ncbi:hypothetical protein [Floridanema aerugineum]|uniref:Uncharacterized protein n=1 Tax=Floridaenema aerugineum BLCC-F46 TaxID=3153654 RepID=A0ABV4X4N4_9CYAN
MSSQTISHNIYLNQDDFRNAAWVVSDRKTVYQSAFIDLKFECIGNDGKSQTCGGNKR